MGILQIGCLVFLGVVLVIVLGFFCETVIYCFKPKKEKRMKIETSYRDTISMSVEDAERFIKNGRKLEVIHMYTREHLGFITPEYFATHRYKKNVRASGMPIYVSPFTKG